MLIAQETFKRNVYVENKLANKSKIVSTNIVTAYSSSALAFFLSLFQKNIEVNRLMSELGALYFYISCYYTTWTTQFQEVYSG